MIIANISIGEVPRTKLIHAKYFVNAFTKKHILNVNYANEFKIILFDEGLDEYPSY